MIPKSALEFRPPDATMTESWWPLRSVCCRLLLLTWIAIAHCGGDDRQLPSILSFPLRRERSLRDDLLDRVRSVRLDLRGGCDASFESGHSELLQPPVTSKTGREPDDAATDREAKHLSAAVSMSKMVFSEEETSEVGFAGIRVRQAGVWDVLDMQRINLVCLPENYQTQYFWYHILRWPSLAFVAEAPVTQPKPDEPPWRVIGYVLGKMDDDAAQDASATGLRGHVTSLAVMRMHRRKQVAKRLMLASMAQMSAVHGAVTCSLHVRSGNEAAMRLYKHSLGFKEARREQGYYADNEDAFSMQVELQEL